MASARWNELQTAKDALETRKLVERAKGVSMKALGLSEDDAYHLLLKRNRNLRRPLREVARNILAADQAFPPQKRPGEAGAIEPFPAPTPPMSLRPHRPAPRSRVHEGC
jgi:hypothetical protein